VAIILLIYELAASALNLPETRDLPPQLPGSPPGIGVQERYLQCAAFAGPRSITLRFKIAGFFGHEHMR
jgi:hypothetical protein